MARGSRDYSNIKVGYSNSSSNKESLVNMPDRIDGFYLVELFSILNFLLHNDRLFFV
jgi:hypothetical protein